MNPDDAPTFGAPPQPVTYRNPILPGFHPDPSILRVGDDYYLANSSFQWWPGIPLYHSRDMVNWEPAGHVVTRPGQLSLRGVDDSMGLWAPTLRWNDGLFHVVVSMVRQYGRRTQTAFSIDNLLFTAEDIRGPWSDPVYLNDDGIDPDIFWDDDGSAWIASNDISGGSREEGIVARRWDAVLREMVGPRRLLWAGTELGITEGPHLYRSRDGYYLLTAEGGTSYGHAVQLCRSRSLTGPYELSPVVPTLTMKGCDEVYACSGHADIVDGPDGRTWMVCLAKRPSPQRHSILGRETFLLPCRWTEDGWLIVNEGRGIEEFIEAPAGDGTQTRGPGAWTHTEDFDAPELGPDWMFSRGPSPEHLRVGGGALRLRCRPHPLDDINAVNVVGRRQQHHRFRATVDLEFAPMPDGEAAGLACYYDRRHWLWLSARHEGGPVLVYECRNGDEVERYAIPWPETDGATLRVDADWERYSFLARPRHGGDWTTIGTATNGGILSDEMAGVVEKWAAFTGAFVCLFATSNGRRSTAWAAFRHFVYEGLEAGG